MWCLLQVVKWFTKCLFYNWLLKICIGLSLHVVSLVHVMFCKRSNLPPRGMQLSPHASSSGSCLCLEAKTGAHTTKSDFLLFCVFGEPTRHVKDEHKCIFTTGKHSTEDSYIYLTICQSLGELLSRQLSLLSCFCHVALSPRVKWLLFLHEHFSSSHRNKKPQCTVA